MLHYKTEREHARNSFGPLPFFIVNEKTLNLEKTTSSVLSVLLFIYDLDSHRQLIELVL